MAEPLNITKKLKERLGELPIFEYVGTCEGRPVYMVSKLSKYELEHTCNGGLYKTGECYSYFPIF